jgi:hypothetical protein
MTITERCAQIWDRVRRDPRQTPSNIRIPLEHVDSWKSLGLPFQAEEHYFQVRVNEMYLVNQREWFKEYDPLVFVTTEFLYKDRYEVVPFVVGPSMMQNFGAKVPAGMIFSNTTVAGPHPYRGGALKLAVVLGRFEQADYARELLSWVEKATKLFDFAGALSQYLKVANLVLDGVDGLLGGDGTKTLTGLRKEIDPAAGDTLAGGYYALIDKPGIDANKLWVREHQLLCGDSMAAAQPFRDADYLLYSITQAGERTDLPVLPFYPLYQRVIEEAMQATTSERWMTTKADLVSLAQTLRFSPDLTRKQARDLREKFTNEMVQEHEQAVDNAKLGPGVKDRELSQVAQILEL